MEDLTLDKYIDILVNFRAENPRSGGKLVIYSSDDEGNSHDMVKFTPTLGFFGPFEFDDSKKGLNANAVCIN